MEYYISTIVGTVSVRYIVISCIAGVPVAFFVLPKLTKPIFDWLTDRGFLSGTDSFTKN